MGILVGKRGVRAWAILVPKPLRSHRPFRKFYWQPEDIEHARYEGWLMSRWLREAAGEE